MALVEEGLEHLNLRIEPESLQALQRFWQRMTASEAARQKLEALPAPTRTLCFFFLAALTKQAPELARLPLVNLCERLADDQELHGQLKTVVAAGHDILAELQQPLEDIQRIMTDYGHYRLIYLSLCTLCKKFGLAPATKEKLWLCFLQLTAGAEEQRIDHMIETVAALIFLHRRGAGEALAPFLDSFERNTHYRVDAEELERRCAEVEAAVPDFLAVEFDAQRYEQLYRTQLGPQSINYLFFLKSARSVVSTPLHASALKVASHPHRVISKAGTLQRNLAFSRLPVAESAEQPDARLLSPLVKKEIDSLDYFKNHSEMLEWVKSVVRSVELVRVELGDGLTAQVSAQFKQFLGVSETRRGFAEVAQLLRRLGSADSELFVKFYFRILELLVERELRERKEGAKSALQDGAFMVALFAFCYELRLFVQMPSSSRELLHASRTYIASAFDFYKVLLNFTQIVYRELPKLIKAHVYRLEYGLLLKEFWARPRAGEEFVPRRLYRCQEELCALVLGKLRNFMAERLYLTAHALGVDDDSKDRVWESFDLLLAAGMGAQDPEELWAFKYDIHLDALLLAVLWEWRGAEQWEFAQSLLYSTYAERVLFPQPSIREDVAQLLQAHGETIAAMVRSVRPSRGASRAELNSTPVLSAGGWRQRQPRVSLSLADNLNLSLDKRSYTDYSAAAAQPALPQIHTQQTEARNVFNFGFQRVKTSNLVCALPSAEHSDAPETADDLKTPGFGD